MRHILLTGHIHTSLYFVSHVIFVDYILLAEEQSSDNRSARNVTLKNYKSLGTKHHRSQPNANIVYSSLDSVFEHYKAWYMRLIHWRRYKMAAVLQTTFSEEFHWIKMYEFR